MTGEPRETDPRGPFRPAGALPLHRAPPQDPERARARRRAVIRRREPGRGDGLPRPSWHHAGPGHRGALRAARSATPSWPRRADLAGCGRIERAMAPASRALPGARARIRSRSSASGGRPPTCGHPARARMRPSPTRRSWSAPTTTTSAAAARARSRRSRGHGSIRARTTTRPAPRLCWRSPRPCCRPRGAPRTSSSWRSPARSSAFLARRTT